MVIHCTMYVLMIDRKRLFFSFCVLASCWVRGFFSIGLSNGKRLGVILTNVVINGLDCMPL